MLSHFLKATLLLRCECVCAWACTGVCAHVCTCVYAHECLYQGRISLTSSSAQGLSPLSLLHPSCQPTSPLLYKEQPLTSFPLQLPFWFFTSFDNKTLLKGSLSLPFSSHFLWEDGNLLQPGFVPTFNLLQSRSPTTPILPNVGSHLSPYLPLLLSST